MPLKVGFYNKFLGVRVVRGSLVILFVSWIFILGTWGASIRSLDVSVEQVCGPEVSHRVEVTWGVDAAGRCNITLQLRDPAGAIQTFVTHEPSGTHTFEVFAPDGGEISVALTAQDGTAMTSRSTGAWLPPCVRMSRPKREREEEITAQTAGERPSLASVIVPVVMYYLERYFSGLPAATELDREIRAVLDESPEARGSCEAALEHYRSLPEAAKMRMFDPEVVRMTATPAEALDLEQVRTEVARASGGLVWKYRPPTAPTGLSARNASTLEPVQYGIELNWNDNSNDEEGFLIFRAFKGPGKPLGPFQLIAQVGANTTSFLDRIPSTPTNAEDRYCYRVAAFATASFNPLGKAPTRLESRPSGMACSYYAPGYPPPNFPDLDKDGFPDQADACPGVPGIWPHGCPDKDRDGVPDKDDLCPTEPMQWFSAPGYEDKGPPLPVRAVRFGTPFVGWA